MICLYHPAIFRTRGGSTIYPCAFQRNSSKFIDILSVCEHGHGMSQKDTWLSYDCTSSDLGLHG